MEFQSVITVFAIIWQVDICTQGLALTKVAQPRQRPNNTRMALTAEHTWLSTNLAPIMRVGVVLATLALNFMTACGGGSTSSNPPQSTATPPTISSFSPTSGGIGASVIITGT